MTWSRIGSRLAAEYRIFRTRWDNYRSPQGIEHEFVVLSSSDYVNVIALTPEQQVVMIRQYRHGVQEETWEIPGGLVDENEEPLHAAQRELLEETGYAARAEDWTLLGWSWPNPAIQDNRMWTFLARDARLVSATEFDPLEEIELALWPRARVDEAWCQGEMRHALIAHAWSRLQAHEQKEGRP